MKIDIELYKKECPKYELHSNWVPRRIMTELIKQRSMNATHYGKIVVGFDVLLYLEDMAGFNIRPIDFKSSYLEWVGSFSGWDVYKDNTWQMKSDEVFLFNEEYEIPFMKSYQRKKKLERILK